MLKKNNNLQANPSVGLAKIKCFQLQKWINDSREGGSRYPPLSADILPRKIYKIEVLRNGIPGILIFKPRFYRTSPNESVVLRVQFNLVRSQGPENEVLSVAAEVI